MKVRAKLNYRSFSQHFVDHLLGEGEIRVPMVTMNDIEAVYGAADLAEGSTIDRLRQSDDAQEAARLLEVYLGPEKAEKNVDRLVRACAACHGENGLGRSDDIPDLAGQNQVYLLSALRAYKSGTRGEERMNAMTRGLSDQQLTELANYYSALPVSD